MESKYDYVVFDIETTGLHPESDQICEIAAIGVKDGLPQGLFSTLVAIEGSMPEAAGRVNGITDDMLKGAPAIGDALDAFLDFIGEDATLAGHNIASFDIPFVQAAGQTPFALVADASKATADNAVDFQFGVDGALIDAAAPTVKAGSYDLAPTGAAGATLTLKAQGNAKNVKADVASAQNIANITWTFAAGQGK